jgi:hypothetical protein
MTMVDAGKDTFMGVFGGEKDKSPVLQSIIFTPWISWMGSSSEFSG